MWEKGRRCLHLCRRRAVKLPYLDVGAAGVDAGEDTVNVHEGEGLVAAGGPAALAGRVGAVVVQAHIRPIARERLDLDLARASHAAQHRQLRLVAAQDLRQQIRDIVCRYTLWGTDRDRRQRERVSVCGEETRCGTEALAVDYG